jgi:multicomponent K+:H+ antiporter subunit F/multicomponent Na+:H+ antiporter subunit F
MTPVDIPLGVIAVAFALTLARIALGPTLADRIVAAELAYALLLAVIVLLAVRLESPHALMVAVVGALLQFVASSALAYLMDRPDDRPGSEQ